ncbi:MAG: hypothetical protein R2867_10350 [Caldilineaceae bacterium]
MSNSLADEVGYDTPDCGRKAVELFLLFAVVVALVGTVLRQQAIREIEGLEAEVQRFRLN